LYSIIFVHPSPPENFIALFLTARPTRLHWSAPFHQQSRISSLLLLTGTYVCITTHLLRTLHHNISKHFQRYKDVKTYPIISTYQRRITTDPCAYLDLLRRLRNVLFDRSRAQRTRENRYSERCEHEVSSHHVEKGINTIEERSYEPNQKVIMRSALVLYTYRSEGPLH
jgi:hypothetical protein